MERKIKIFDYCWHIPHQWDMINALKKDCEFFYGLTTKRQWDVVQRPVPEVLNFVTHYEPGKYDVAILHLDQQSISFNHQKRLIYEQFNHLIQDVPKIVINHGTPVFPEHFPAMGLQLTAQEAQEKCIAMIREMVGDNLMVVNSYASAGKREWGFGYPIVHGMDPDEWYDLPKEPRVFTALSPMGFDTYYNRSCMIEVVKELHHTYGHILRYAKLNARFDSVEAYKTYLGKSLIYLGTSIRTPMNRARTEAFLSGCCVVQVEGAHDLERWARPGENLILVPDDPQEIARVVARLLEENYQEAIAIGRRGREMAVKQFSRERYRREWLKLLNKVINK